MAVGPGPSYISFESCGLLKSLTISCDNPFGWFELVLAEDVNLADVCEPAGALAGVAAGLADDCEPAGSRVGGPVCVLVDEVVFGKKLSDVLTTGENLIFFLASLQDSFSSLSSS